MTKIDRRQEAIELASRPYSQFVFLDETTDNESIYVATNPELKGCIAQGETIQEAEGILAEVRVDYINHLLINNLPVPAPMSPLIHTRNSGIQLSSKQVKVIRVENDANEEDIARGFFMQTAVHA